VGYFVFSEAALLAAPRKVDRRKRYAVWRPANVNATRRNIPEISRSDDAGVTERPRRKAEELACFAKQNEPKRELIVLITWSIAGYQV
jgi:hypothetical protein